MTDANMTEAQLDCVEDLVRGHLPDGMTVVVTRGNGGLPHSIQLTGAALYSKSSPDRNDDWTFSFYDSASVVRWLLAIVERASLSTRTLLKVREERLEQVRAHATDLARRAELLKFALSKTAAAPTHQNQLDAWLLARRVEVFGVPPASTPANAGPPVSHAEHLYDLGEKARAEGFEGIARCLQAGNAPPEAAFEAERALLAEQLTKLRYGTKYKAELRKEPMSVEALKREPRLLEAAAQLFDEIRRSVPRVPPGIAAEAAK
jgi:hypothetical protein